MTKIKCDHHNGQHLASKGFTKIPLLVLTVILFVLVSGFAFYWHEWRPTQIRKNCVTHKETFDVESLYGQYLTNTGLYYHPNKKPLVTQEDIDRGYIEKEATDEQYDRCLKANGLIK